MNNAPVHHEEAIRALAHKFWEAEGRPEGRAEAHWLRAVSELNVPEISPVAQKSAKKNRKK